jgi:predicted negative regulator of RcsB-dependent stress response
VDRQLKKVAKTDEFKEGFWHLIGFSSEHLPQLKKYGAIVLGVLVIAGGIYFFVQHQATVREEALAEALKVDDATVGANPNPAAMHFDTADQKAQAVQKAYAEVAAKYHGSQEGAIAQMNLVQAAVDKGDNANAEKQLKDMMDSAPKAYASQAAITLADLYRIQGKYADAEKILEDLLKNPTVTVSKEEAQLALAKVKMHTDPKEAQKMLADLRTSRTVISRAALNALAEMQGIGQ